MQLITGSEGFIGSRLMKRIDAIGVDIKDGINIIDSKLPANIDVIYHLAAYKSVEESWIKPLLYTDNLKMLIRLVHKYPDAKIIHASSCAGVDPLMSPYGFMKKAASDYLKTFHKNYVNLIFPNIYGGEQPQNSVVDTFKKADTLTIQGDGSIVRSYVHVDDIVQALVQAKDWPVGEYFMGSGKGTTVLELARATGKGITFVPARSGGKEPPDSPIQNTTPDWEPSIDVMEYIV